jgi:menaquinone-specific isochorismate synthase
VKTATPSFRTEPASAGDLIGALPRAGGLAWLHGGEGFVAGGRAARFDPGTGPDRFRRAAAALDELWSRAPIEDAVGSFGTGALAFGSFTFDPAAAGSSLVVPEFVVGARAGATWSTRATAPGGALGGGSFPSTAPSPERAADRIRYGGSTLSEIQWLEAVDAAVRAVRAGSLEKVVLARDMLVWSGTPFVARVLLDRLVRRFPQCYTFLYEGLIGASPELLVRRRGTTVESLVLAGSAARAPNPTADAALGEALLASAKDVAEHTLAVDSVTRVLGPLCSTIDVDASPGLLRLENVQHLATSVRGELAVDGSALELAGALHPTSAVCGEPTSRALQLIRDREGMQRGRYGGPVGWVDHKGDGEWAIALRCAELSGSRARLFAGAGIVDGSRPESELEETRLKFRAMLSALEGA